MIDYEERREALRAALPDIAAKVTAALTEAGLKIPIYFAVPSSGISYLSLCTPLNPSDAEWDEVGQVVAEIVAEHTGSGKLKVSDVSCIAAGGAVAAGSVVEAPMSDQTDVDV